MKAIGRNLVIEKIEEGTTETKGGLLLAELHRDDIRYIRASIIEVGDEVLGLKKHDLISVSYTHLTLPTNREV